MWIKIKTGGHLLFQASVRLLSVLVVVSLVSACSANSTPEATPPLQSVGADTAASVGKPTGTQTSTPAPPTATVTSTRKPPTATPRPSATTAPTLPPDGFYHPAGPVAVPILLYHRVTNQGNTQYIVPVAEFRAQIKALSEAGYQSINISDLAQVMLEGGALPEKPVVITFDDGFTDVYENAFPILEEYGYRATVYIISGTVGTDLSYGYMQEEQLKALAAAGWEIGSHSISHNNLETSRLGIRTELSESKKTLEEKLGVDVKSFSYPYAITNNWIQARVKEYGYTSAVGVGMRVAHTPEHIYYLSRREVYRGTGLRAFRSLLELGEQESAVLTPAVLTPSVTPTPHSDR